MPGSPLFVRFLAILAILIPVAPVGPVVPDDGMWTFDNVPVRKIKERYGFDITPAWLDHVRLSSVRVSTGGSGSFVSPNGLVMTNHHVALELVNKLSTVEMDLTKDGFHAKTHEEELKCPDAEIRHLVSMRDVTAEVEEAAASQTTPAAAAQARARAMEKIAASEREKTGLTVDIVTLYGGGQYVAYGYKTWNDVRLVFAPEMRIGFYGGDFDNFCYPRYCLDASFLRVYENGKPADTSAHYLRWSKEGPKENELVFVSGHPGDTGRLLPVSRINYERDVYNPVIIEFLSGQERALMAYSARGETEKLKVLDELFSVRNSLKAFNGHQAGLLDATIMARKQAEEDDLKAKVGDDADLKKALEIMDGSVKVRSETFPILFATRIEGDLAGPARSVLRALEEIAKPVPEGEKRDLAPLLERVGKDTPVDLARQQDQLETALSVAARHLGAGHPFVKLALGADQTAAAAAARLIKTTKLGTPAGRQELLKAAVDGKPVDEPIIEILKQAAKLRAEALPKYQRAEMQEGEALRLLAKARFKAYGTSQNPDATFTLRLSYGNVSGYEHLTTKVPWKTTFYGLFARNAELDNAAPFDLPKRWLDAKSQLDLSTPFNFVTTCDIIGGNSGSPVINQKAEVVGLIFDGNIQSLPSRYIYDEREGRSVAVHSVGITHALARVYGAHALLAELGVQ